jgi:hypothetical protein
LLDLKSKKELQLSHHGHLDPIHHNPTKFLIKSHISIPNITSSTYIWQTKISLLTLRVNRVTSVFPIANPCWSRKFFKQSY